MKNLYKVLFTVILVSLMSSNVFSQYASKRIRSKYEAYTDSLKKVDYNYVFPFWGQGAYSKGIDIQYPMGIMTNFFWTKQGVTIDNFQLGFDNAHDGIVEFPLTPLSDSIISFGDNSNTAYSFNIRPDIWLFPFINLYGIFGYGHSETTVEVNALKYSENPLNFTSVVDQGIATYGFGVLAAGGVGPVWLSVDANFTWNKPELLDKPTMVNIVGIRMGKAFVFKNRPHSNISVWIGTMYLTMQSETNGAVSLKDAISQDFWDNKDEKVANYWNWYNNEASPVQKVVADKILTPVINAIDERNGESVVAYNMDKQTKQHWNGLVGFQYQINKHWQVRTEGGVVGDRKSFLANVNYRFLGFKKKSKF